MKHKKSPFLILDFGSQYTWLIARCLREMGFYSQVEAYDFSLEKIKQLQPPGIILSGGPDSVLDPASPQRCLKELSEIAPLLGICYGFQLICKQWGGKIHRRTEVNKTVISSSPFKAPPSSAFTPLSLGGENPPPPSSASDTLPSLGGENPPPPSSASDTPPFRNKKTTSPFLPRSGKNGEGAQTTSATGSYGKKYIYWGRGRFNPWASRSRKKIFRAWMSHGDYVSQIPPSFELWAETKERTPAVLFRGDQKSRIQSCSLKPEEGQSPESEEGQTFWQNKLQNLIFALQFHPEVSHTSIGKYLLRYFTQILCQVSPESWTPSLTFTRIIKQVQTQLKKKDYVLCALSGGVDSTVTAVLLTHILTSARVFCVFVDTGLLRKNEFKDTLLNYKILGLNVKGVRAESVFLKALKGVKDPEKKRKIIGKTFIDVFKAEAQKKSGITHLAQGTLYPDVIESLSIKGPSAIIKSHHNVGGLPKNMPFKLIEPLRELFKDEVRLLGQVLKIPPSLIKKHPFPGPGLAVRISGEITPARLQKLREADFIYIEELKRAKLYHKIWQAFCVLLSDKSVGVQGDSRTYEETIVLRAVVSKDGMTADWFYLPQNVLHHISDRITNEVTGVNRVLYDITTKPPGTIEWM